MNIPNIQHLPIDILKIIAGYIIDYSKTKHYVKSLCIKGNIDGLKWVHNNKKDDTWNKAIDYAAENGHLEVVKWLHNNRTEGCTTDAMNGAAENGHGRVPQYFVFRTF